MQSTIHRVLNDPVLRNALKEVARMYSAFMALCENADFDISEARRVLAQIDLSKEFEHAPKWNGHTYSPIWFTPLSMAVFYNNVRMLQLLLSLGADPNVVYNEYENVLWDLQYNDGETDEENENRLVMAKYLLEYGADPLVDPENDGEPLLDYIIYAVFNDDLDALWEYRSRFLILLVAYGAKSQYCTPRVVGEFDKDKLAQYKFYMVPEDNGKYSGAITNGQGAIVAYV